MENYLILDATGLVVNAAYCDPSVYPVDQAWIPQSSVPVGVWIGWTTPDGGTTWVAPVSI